MSVARGQNWGKPELKTLHARGETPRDHRRFYDNVIGTMKITLLLAVAIFAASATAQSEKKKVKIESSVRAVLTDQVAAWNRGDIENFMEGYWRSEEMRFVSGNNVSKGWQAAYDRYKKNYDSREKMGTLSFSELEINVLGKKSVLVKGRFTLARENDKPTGLFTLIFRKIDGDWKIIHDHTST